MAENTPSIVKTNFKNLKNRFVEIKEISFLSQEYNTYNLIKKVYGVKQEKFVDQVNQQL